MRDEADISLVRHSTAEVVADTLMRLIVSGELASGVPLREQRLAARLGISRNTLREGIRLLEQSRLVRYELHRGAVVSTPSTAEFADLTRTRRHLELLAVQQIPTATELDRIEQALAELAAAAVSRDPRTIVAKDLALHQTIVDLLRSERLSTFFTQIRKELVFAFTVISLTDREYARPEETVLTQHRDIVDAIRDGRTHDAAALLAAHIDESLARVQEILESDET